MRKFVEKKIAYQLLVKVMVVIALVICLVGLSVVIFMRTTLEKGVNHRLASQTKRVESEVSALFQSAETYAHQLALNQTIIDYLSQIENLEDIENHPQYDNILNLLLTINKNDSNNYLAWIANEKANFYLTGEGVTPGPNYRIKQRPWYKPNLFSKGLFYSDPYFDWGTDQIVLSAIRVLNLQEDNRGFIAIDFNLNIIPEVIKNIDLGKTGEVFVVDEKGLFIYHPSKSFVLQENIQNVLPDLSTYTSELDDSKALSKIRVNGENYYLKTLDVDPIGWQLIILIGREEVMAPLRDFLWQASVYVLILLIIGSYAIAFFIQKKLKPIEAISAYGTAIAGGNLEEVPPYEYAKRKDEMGDLARSFVTITEVFKQKNAALADEIKNQQDEIQKQYHYILEKEKMASIGTLVAGIAHEINTPLGVSITTSSYMRELIGEISSHYKDKKLSKSFFESHLLSIKEASALLLTNLRRGALLVDQFKSITSTGREEAYEKVDMKEFVDQVLDSLRPAYKHRPIAIENNIEDGVITETVPRGMTQVITNLIMNSLHHGFEQEDSGSISFRGRIDGDMVNIIYKDTGKGMELETLDHIFEPFYTTKKNSNNSGLGMFIVHNLVHQTLGGSIKCKSQPGQGVTFLISLPKKWIFENKS